MAYERTLFTPKQLLHMSAKEVDEETQRHLNQIYACKNVMNALEYAKPVVFYVRACMDGNAKAAEEHEATLQKLFNNIRNLEGHIVRRHLVGAVRNAIGTLNVKNVGPKTRTQAYREFKKMVDVAFP